MPIIISNFHQGQASSPYLTDGAFAKSCNLDIDGQKGIARINYKPVASTGVTLTGLPTSADRYVGSANLFIGCSDNNVYLYNVSAGTLEAKSSNGNAGKHIVNFGYMLSLSDNHLKYYTFGTTWTLFKSLTGNANNKPFLSLNDGRLYIPQGVYVSLLYEKAGQTFNPEDPNTYEWSPTAFRIPSQYYVYAINELGKYLVLACSKHITANPKETIYLFWDRSSSTADYIYRLSEPAMFNMKKVGETLFVSGGMQGNIYALSISGLQFYKQIPFDYDDAKRISINSNVHTAEGLINNNLDWWNNQLIAGVTSLDGLVPAGIYGIKERPNHLFTVSSGEDGTNDTYIGFVKGLDNEHLIFGWKTVVGSTTTYGLDYVKNSNYRTASYGSYFESIFYPVGTKDDKKSFDKVEVQLARPLQEGEGVRIKYRQNINDDWTTLGTQDYDTYGAVSSLIFPGIHNLENIQIRCELTTGTNSKNTPYIKEIRLLP